MIKTTSFALPRPAQSSPQSKSRARQHAIKAAKTRAAAQSPAQPNLGALFPVPTPAPEISAAQAREMMQASTPNSQSKAKPKAKTAPATPVPATAARPVPTVETTMPSTSPAPKKTPRTAKSKEASPVVAQEPVIVAPVEAAPAEVVAAIVEKTAPKKATGEAKKARRPRVPVNLAEQYGQSLSKRVENGIEAVVEDNSPKKRLNRAERQARRELMNPDDDLMARLHRVHSAVPSAKPVKRPRGWRFDCGRCGQTSFFQTNGAICNCGALAIKE